MSKSQAKNEPSSAQARRSARARRLRGAVLELLAEESPERLNADVLLGVLERLHYDVTARGLAAALAYLRSRAYVEFEELRSRQVARVLGLQPGSPRAVVIREFLLGEIFRLAFEKSRSPNAMLQELHQALKAVPVEASGKKKKGMNPVEQGREIRRRWRALYGLDTPPEVDGESDRTG